MKSSYGIDKQHFTDSVISESVESIRLTGFAVLEGLISPNKATALSEKLDLIYQQQEEDFGKEKLLEIGEKDTVRCPLVSDEEMLRLATDPTVLEIVANLLGSYIILHLQNGIINRPGETHHQTSWHRDLPYQNFTSSDPLAVSALWCLDDFSSNNGATQLIPGSHKQNMMPSNSFIAKQKFTLEAPAGSVVIFDSMVFHRAGVNVSSHTRRGINHVYSIPLIKQQIDIPAMLGRRFNAQSEMGKFLGYDSETPKDVQAFRDRRWGKRN